jgi:hypothetical protein
MESLPAEFKAESLRMALRAYDTERRTGPRAVSDVPELQSLFRPCVDEVPAGAVMEMIQQMDSSRRRWDAIEGAVGAGFELPVAIAFDSAFEDRDDETCLQRLCIIEKLFANKMMRTDPALTAALSSALRRLATRGRGTLLRGMVSLLPLVAQTSGTDAFDEAANAVLDVGAAWP